MTEDEIKIEKPNEIVNIVEKITTTARRRFKNVNTTPNAQ